MIADLLTNETCKWCGRSLSKSYLTMLSTGGIEKKDSLLYPALCLCGGITVIGAGTFISHFEELSVKKESA
jgi:hypothetical protein